MNARVLVKELALCDLCKEEPALCDLRIDGRVTVAAFVIFPFCWTGVPTWYDMCAERRRRARGAFSFDITQYVPYICVRTAVQAAYRLLPKLRHMFLSLAEPNLAAKVKKHYCQS